MTLFLAHGTGEAAAFPVDITYALIGGSWALAISFLVLAFAWKTPRLGPEKSWVRLPALTRFADSPALRTTLGAAGITVALAAAIVAFLARDEHENPLVGTFFIWLWVGLVPASLLLGPIGRIISPLRTAHRWVCRLVGRAPDDGWRELPASWGRWPAAVGLFAFVWLELAVVDKGLAAVAGWVLAYVVVMISGAALFGSSWFSHADPFEVYSATIATMSPLGRDEKSRELVLRNPLRGLSTFGAGPDAVALIAILLGSTAFDAWSATHSATGVGLRTAILLLFIGVVGTTFCLATMATGGVTRARRLTIPGRMAYTLIPIAVGYLIAHYAKYFVEDGQRVLHAWLKVFGVSPPGMWTPFTDHPTVLSVLAVGAIIVGHLLAVVAAHDAALRILPKRHHLTGQLALMLLMVGYTFTGLWLLFGG